MTLRSPQTALRPILLSAVAVLILLVAGPSWGAEVDLSWDPSPSTEVTGYRLYYDTDDGEPPYEGTGANEGDSPIDLPLADFEDPEVLETSLTGMTTCVHYWFALTAYSPDAESVYSNMVEATVLGKPGTVVASTVEPNAVQLSWSGLADDDSGAVSQYLVHTYTDFVDADNNTEVTGSPMVVTGQLSADVTGLTAGVTYFFTVEATCDDGEAAMSSAVETTPFADSVGDDVGVFDSGTPDTNVPDTPAPDVAPPDVETQDTPAHDTAPADDVAEADLPLPTQPDAANDDVATNNMSFDGGGADVGASEPGGGASGSADSSCACSISAPKKPAVPLLALTLAFWGLISVRRSTRP